ncbi:UPF0182 family protein [Isoptericola sediminis]|uniref:UPF0182 protein HLI28_09685 n=1 Tax=Isoptericola sediminis TaxID=2733572 RepID=A0A849K3E5_9MICO|nr:COG1615 family transporter [Isoptericola sediminis]
MSFAPPRRPDGPAPSRRRSPLLITLVVLAALVVVLLFLTNFWTEVLWFTQVGYANVIWTQWITRSVLFVVAFLIMAAAVYSSFAVGYRTRPIYAPSTPEQATLDQYREAVEPLRKVVTYAGPVLIGFFAGVAASAQWETVLLALNGQPFGTADPEFGLDVGFYVFMLPVLRFVVSFLMAVLVISTIAAVVTHYLYGGVRLGPIADGASRTTTAARVHLAVLGTLIMLLVATNYWLDRYSILTSQHERFDGANYTDVHAVIPSKEILTGVAVLVAILFVVAAFRDTWRLPAIGVGLMVVSAIAIGAIYPAVVQRFQVDPNAQSLEAPYIQRNIDATLDAFDIAEVESQQYDATTVAEAGQLRDDAGTTTQVRLLDPQVVSPSFRQLQQNKQYYNFTDNLAVDRYEIDGESRDTVIAVRELNLSGLADRNWTNDRTVFTHGFGVVAAYGNQPGPDGQPAFFEGGIPTQGALTDMFPGGYEPRIYFSPEAPPYSIVGAPEGTDPWELDYQADAEGGQQELYSFPTDEVSAGPEISTFLQRLLYALRFGDEEIFFSDRVTEVSQILYDRDPQERVSKVAPWLTLDNKVYPAVVDGRVKWVIDAYTTSDAYPYSASNQMQEATTDSLTAAAQGLPVEAPPEVNYIRNSVKATVDAYDGSVTLYAWDDEDPLLQAWNDVFPDSVRPISEMSGSLMSHVRYPEDLFKVQRTLLERYHVTEAQQFFAGSDEWRTPDDPVGSDDALMSKQPPYYLTLQMPGEDDAAFSLTSTFIPGGFTDREILTGYLAAEADAGSEDGEIAEGYGTLRLLELPRDSTVPGPGQVQNNFNSNPTISEQLNILGRGDSEVVRGNQLTLPVGGGLLYVQPVYIQSGSGTQFPLLRRVLVAFGDQTGYAETLDEALDQVFGGDSGAEAGDADEAETEVPTDQVDPETGEPIEPSPEPTEAEPTQEPTPSPTETTEETQAPPAGDAQARLDAALQDANEALNDSNEALQNGDWTAYGEAQERLQTALEEALAAEGELNP